VKLRLLLFTKKDFFLKTKHKTRTLYNMQHGAYSKTTESSKYFATNYLYLAMNYEHIMTNNIKKIANKQPPIKVGEIV